MHATNLNIRRSPDSDIHRGFQAAIDAAREEIGRAVKLARDGDKPLFVTGHSLGAALAVLAARYADGLVGGTPRGVYVYGIPRVGGERFRDEYNARRQAGTAALAALGFRSYAEATGGRVIAQLVKANQPPEFGTGWHRHVADFHIVLMLKGWARFMYDDEEHLVATGDCVHQRPGITHYLFDYSPDMEYLEIAAPADFKTVDVEGPCAVPAPGKWTEVRDDDSSVIVR